MVIQRTDHRAVGPLHPTGPGGLYRSQRLQESTADTLLLSTVRGVFHHAHVSEHVIRGEMEETLQEGSPPSIAASIGSMTKKPISL